MTAPTSAVQVARDNYVAVRREISDKATSELQKFLSPERAVRFVQTGLRALSKNPDLLTCTQKSLTNAFYDAAVLDLEPVLGSVYFIKYGNEATLQIGYRGLVELAKRGDPTIEDLYGQAVYEGDSFDYQEGDDPRLIHKPDLTRTVSDPTKITHFYAIAFRLGGRRPIFVVLTKNDVDGIRARSKARNAGPWVTDFPAMGMKTAVRNLCNRRLSLSATIKEALERDDDREYGTLPTVPSVAGGVTPARTSSLKESIKQQAQEIEGTTVEVAVDAIRASMPVNDEAAAAEIVASAESASQPTEPASEPTFAEDFAAKAAAAQAQLINPDQKCGEVSPYGDGVICPRKPGHPGSHMDSTRGAKTTW